MSEREREREREEEGKGEKGCARIHNNKSHRQKKHTNITDYNIISIASLAI